MNENLTTDVEIMIEQLKVLSNGVKKWLKKDCEGDCYGCCHACDEINDIDDFLDRLLKE